MSQPVWKFIAQLGDANPIDHGGQFLFVDETDVYDPQLEVLELIEGDEDDEYNENDELVHEGNMKWETHRFSLPKCTYQNGVLSENKYHPEHPAWFADGISSVANCVGADVDELISHLCGDDIQARARAYMDIAGHWGINNFDDYPIDYDNRRELEERYADCKAPPNEA